MQPLNSLGCHSPQTQHTSSFRTSSSTESSSKSSEIKYIGPPFEEVPDGLGFDTTEEIPDVLGFATTEEIPDVLDFATTPFFITNDGFTLLLFYDLLILFSCKNLLLLAFFDNLHVSVELTADIFDSEVCTIS